MSIKPHVQLDTNNQFEKRIALRFNFGDPNADEDEAPRQGPRDYTQMAGNLRVYLNAFTNDQQVRKQQRNPTLNVNQHFDYIRIEFQGQFNLTEYFSQYLNEFGLMGVEFSKFNHEGLFAIVNQDRFAVFLTGLEQFINRESGTILVAEYPTKIRYIKSFSLLKTTDMLRHDGNVDLVSLRLADFPLPEKRREEILSQLFEYLQNANLSYRREDNILEIYGADENQLLAITANFDIVLSVTSGLATLVSPNALNLPERAYGFEVSVPEDDLPIIGILDTGISSLTPLSSIIIDDNDFNLTTSPVYEDNSDGGQGHGTGVAALAALGKKPYDQQYRGEIATDAKLLSMKIMDSNSGYISHLSVIDLLRRAKQKYPSIKIFVLSICYERHMRTNEMHSAYALELDRFAHENDCLISICTANNLAASDHNNAYDLAYFQQEATNICAPADSMNNIIVGAAAGSLKGGDHLGVSTSHEFPTLYTRGSHIDFSKLYPIMKINKNYFRPDVIECGGDYEFSPDRTFIGQHINASMDILSANPAESFYCNIGTSFSAPLVANTAARIQRLYPGIRAQSIKTLIVNGASLDRIRFPTQYESNKRKIAGNGLVDSERSIYSNENSITFLIEEHISPEEFAIFPIKFPDYLINENLGKTNGLMNVTATLCFSFDPVPDNQLVYCPIHMAFCFFKNHSADDIQKPNEKVNSMLKSSLRWSQNGRYKAKPIAASNTQKLSFTVNKADLVNEAGVFKLGVNCRILSQLLPGTANRYSGPHPFSIAITIEETLRPAFTTGDLYNEMMAVNEVVNISSLDLDANGELEAED